MRPDKRLIYAIAGWFCLAIIMVSFRFYYYWKDLETPHYYVEWLCFSALALIGILALIDLLNKSFTKHIQATRNAPGSIAVGVTSSVDITVTNWSDSKIEFQLFDHYPHQVSSQPIEEHFVLEPNQTINYPYKITAHTRGDGYFGYIQLLVSSRFKLWQRIINIPSNDIVKIYPNFTQISHFNMLAGEHNLADMGIHMRQLRGQGMEFHQLRDYRKGDSLRQIDWSATSRKQKMISKEYQEEKDQQIIFLIDCGKRMRTKDSELSHFDHSLNALLLLAYVALKQDDAVGFQTFGGQNRGIMPIKGQQQINLLLNKLYDVHPTLTASDYLKAAQELISKTKKRALVVLVSNMRDDDIPELDPAINLLKKHHLVLLANLKEQHIEKILDQKIKLFSQALNFAEAKLFLRKRQKLLDYFSAKGVVTIDSTPQQLPAHLVNQYFNIKKSGRL